MSIVNLFVRSMPEISGTSFDAVLTESTELRTDVSEYPLEDASTAADNAITRPLTLIMTVGISDNAVKAATAKASSYPGLASAGASITAGTVASALSGSMAALAGLGLTVGSASLSATSEKRSTGALTAIRALQRGKKPFTIISSTGEYENMLITNTRQETNKENENGLELVVEMRQLTIINRQGDAATQNANLTAGDTCATQGQATVNLGEVTVQ